ncbi:hypothetical protein DCAR_0727650 [Daucus carota subsp. sativus]|uniref:Uncharacterized protein n=1 Tax=Daucus carota subsp. sativus TaxID=79200 RepID=A0A161X4C1_DAUCS|nr:PREDICTED: uncharacterized protein LOC108196325 [Daucus carota subsp. sativus]WOH08213.1 hypothetical protein DCAR_0727650 [Daucus carota subsp. sativus]
MAGPDSLKFLCSYGGKILPRHPDGKLRYQGGHTRVLAVPRSISFSELMVKLGELCGTPVTLRCQLPTEDLDALVTITCTEDLKNLIEEYDVVSSLKIRAFLSLPKKPTSPSSSSSSSPKSTQAVAGNVDHKARFPATTCFRHIPKPVGYPVCFDKAAGKVPATASYYANGNPSARIYLIHNGNHWQ